LHRFADIGSQFVLVASLREDALAQRLGCEATISLLRHFKDDLFHSACTLLRVHRCYPLDGGSGKVGTMIVANSEAE